MDALFAAHLGDAAKVQVKLCDEPEKGKGVFALHHLEAGAVALTDAPLAFLGSADLTDAAVEKTSDVAARPHATCAACG